MASLVCPSKLVGMREPTLMVVYVIGSPKPTCVYGSSSSLGLASSTVPSCTGNDVAEEMSISALVVSDFNFSYRKSGSLLVILE